MKPLFEKGFLKLPKSITEWQWYTDANVSRLFFHILIKANFKKNNWQGQEIDVGEFITSLDRLHVELNLSIQAIRTALCKLQKTGYIKTRPTNRYTLIKLLNSEFFPLGESSNNKPYLKQNTASQQSNNNLTTTTKIEYKENTFEERIEIFRLEVYKNKTQFPNEVLHNFFNYWTEKNDHTGRAKFEDEKYWNLDTRLSKWKTFSKTSKEKKFIKNR